MCAGMACAGLLPQAAGEQSSLWHSDASHDLPNADLWEDAISQQIGLID
jgi:hypothetical protein